MLRIQPKFRIYYKYTKILRRYTGFDDKGRAEENLYARKRQQEELLRLRAKLDNAKKIVDARIKENAKVLGKEMFCNILKQNHQSNPIISMIRNFRKASLVLYRDDEKSYIKKQHKEEMNRFMEKLDKAMKEFNKNSPELGDVNVAMKKYMNQQRDSFDQFYNALEGKLKKAKIDESFKEFNRKTYEYSEAVQVVTKQYISQQNENLDKFFHELEEKIKKAKIDEKMKKFHKKALEETTNNLDQMFKELEKKLKDANKRRDK